MRRMAMSDYTRSRRGDGGDGFFCRFTFGQFFALLVLEVFTLFFVFYLGARYGRDFLGLKSSQQLSSNIVSIDEVDARVLTTGDPEAARMADELISRAKTPELKQRIRNMIQGAQKTNSRTMPEVERRNHMNEMAAAEEPSPDRPIVHEKKTEKALERAEIRQKENATTSVIRTKSPMNARYSVQVGSYPQMAEASKVVDRWKNKGYPSFMMIADIPDRGRWYRVRLGGFESREDATHYLRELKSREDVDALIVLNEN
jgi:DedD protein